MLKTPRENMLKIPRENMLKTPRENMLGTNQVLEWMHRDDLG